LPSFPTLKEGKGKINVLGKYGFIQLILLLLFIGKYSEGESRYNLSKKIIKAATMVSEFSSTLLQIAMLIL